MMCHRPMLTNRRWSQSYRRTGLPPPAETKRRLIRCSPAGPGDWKPPAATRNKNKNNEFPVVSVAGTAAGGIDHPRRPVTAKGAQLVAFSLVARGGPLAPPRPSGVLGVLQFRCGLRLCDVAPFGPLRFFWPAGRPAVTSCWRSVWRPLYLIA